MEPPRARDAVCGDLDALVQERGFIYAYAAMLVRDLFLNPADAADINWRERLSFQEFTFLGGLLVKRRIDLSHPTPDDMRSQIERTYQLFEELHDEHGARWLARLESVREQFNPIPENYDAATAELFGSGDMMTEPIFYSSSGAFDFQYWEFAPRRYRLDVPWLKANKGLDIDIAAAIVAAMKFAGGPFASSAPSDTKVPFDDFLEASCVRPSDLSDFASADIEAVFDAFSLEPGTVNEALEAPGHYNQLASHPLVKLEGGRYFLPVYFNLAASLYESPFYWMLADDSYRDQSSRHRGDSTEALVRDLLAEVFGDAQVRRGVKILQGRAVLGEIDVLATLGGKAFIVQCKSKRLTELARTGDTEALKKDFKQAVQAAYDQGLDCRRLLMQGSDLHLEADGGPVAWPLIDEAFIGCVLSDHYPSLTHQVHTYLSKRPDDPNPLAMSIFDLDLLCFYLPDPFEFLYYVRQRTALADVIRSDEEVALLAYHLRHKLLKEGGPDFIAVDPSMAQLIDANFPVAKGQVPRTEAADRLHHEWKNADFEALLASVKASDEPKFVDVAFSLMDMSGATADVLLDGIGKCKRRTATDGQKHSLAMLADDLGVSFVSLGERPERLEDEVLFYAKAKKYSTKKTRWIGFGAMPSSSQPVDVVVFNDEPWVEDEELERLSRLALRAGTHLNPKRKIGRNDPCHCGSGLKYKRCHGRR
jgi:hypothetical protein